MKEGTRKLVVIMFADIAGYSALMQKDEPQARTIIRKFQQLIKTEIPQNGGRIIEIYGDGTLCTFENSLDAVECALKLQERFRDQPNVPVRMAINSGSVIFEDGRIYGDHVNITGRIESMSIPGAILISNNIYLDIKNQPHIDIEPLGSFDFKNIDKPLEIFALSNSGLTIPKKGEITGKFTKKSFFEKHRTKLLIAFIGLLGLCLIPFLLSDTSIKKQTIAVLPFNEVNTSGDYQSYLYKIRFELHHHLSRLSGISLLSLNEILPIEKTVASNKALSKRLNLDYSITGNALFQDDHESIFQIELVESDNNRALWADNYSFAIENDFFNNVATMAEHVVEQLEIKITPKEKLLISKSSTNNEKAFEFYLQAHKLAQSRDSTDLSNSVKLLDKAIGLDSTFALAYAEKSSKLFAQGYKQYVPRDVAYMEAERLANHALALDSEVFVAHSVLATIEELVKRNKTKADSLYSLSIQVNPNDATAHRHYSLFKKRERDYTRAEELAKRSVDLSPGSAIANRNYVDILIYNKKYETALSKIRNYVGDEIKKEQQFWGYLGDIYSRSGDINQAISYYEKRIDKQANLAGELGYCYGKLGQTEKALSTLSKITRGQYRYTNMALVFAGLSEHDRSYRDSTLKYLNKSLDLGVGLNVVCDHPFFQNVRDEYCNY